MVGRRINTFDRTSNSNFSQSTAGMEVASVRHDEQVLYRIRVGNSVLLINIDTIDGTSNSNCHRLKDLVA